MPSEVTWPDIAVRLALTVVAGVLFGIDRSARGRAAGLRSTLLVCLAASLAMIQANLLLSTTGKTGQAFSVMDTLRLPLGILTGVGFIGAGTILRHGTNILGITTAATMWATTVIGLCFGAGELGLGGAGLALALAGLWGLKPFEWRLPRQWRGTLLVVADAGALTEDELRACARARLRAAGYEIASWCFILTRHTGAQRYRLRCEVKWHAGTTDIGTPEFVRQLAEQPGVRQVPWKM